MGAAVVNVLSELGRKAAWFTRLVTIIDSRKKTFYFTYDRRCPLHKSTCLSLEHRVDALSAKAGKPTFDD